METANPSFILWLLLHKAQNILGPLQPTPRNVFCSFRYQPQEGGINFRFVGFWPCCLHCPDLGRAQYTWLCCEKPCLQCTSWPMMSMLYWAGPEKMKATSKANVRSSYALISPALPRSRMFLQFRQPLFVFLLILLTVGHPANENSSFSLQVKQLWNIPMFTSKPKQSSQMLVIGAFPSDASQVAGCSRWTRAFAKLADQRWPGSPTKQVQCELNSGRKWRVCELGTR